MCTTPRPAFSYLLTAEQKQAARRCRQLRRKLTRAVATGNEARVQAVLTELQQADSYFVGLMRTRGRTEPYSGA